MVKCSFTTSEQIAMAALGDYLLIDDLLFSRMNNGIFDDETEKLAKEFKEKEKNWFSIKASIPLDSKLFNPQANRW